MTPIEKPQLSFHGVDILEIKFHANKPIESDIDISFDIQPRVYYPVDEKNAFKIHMNVLLKAGENYELEITALGSFSFDQIIDENLKKSYINLNGPAIMFPYVRAFITTISSNSGNSMGSVSIPPRSFGVTLEEIILDPISGTLKVKEEL